MQFRVDGMVFSGREGDATFTISRTGLRGVFDGVGMRRERLPRPNAHGQFPAPGYLTGRDVTVSGLILTDSVYHQQKAMRRMAGLLAHGQQRRATVELEGLTVTGDVARGDEPRINLHVPGYLAEYQFQFWADDPRWYGEVREFGAGTVKHDGNFDADPEIEITTATGLPSGYTVSSQGRSYVVSQALTAGQRHRIDMRSGWLYRNDALQSGGVAAARTFSIPAEKPVSVAFSPVSGSGSMTVRVHDTYV